MADCVGQKLGKYHLIRLLGKGGFGDVYLGQHVEDGTQAAIKVLHEPLTNENIKEFVNEAGLCQLLRHESIVRLFDFGIRDDYIPFLAIEYAPNGSLANNYPRGTRIPLDTIITYVKPISAALQYAHDNRLIHRDVKPANFLIGTNGKVLLGDFGIAAIALSTRSQEQQREKQKVVGSWEYAAPEQFAGRAVPASDQYSLAVVVYEWLCGDRPFHGNFDQLVVQHYHLNSPPPPLHEKISISPTVEQVIMKALAKNPEHRYESVETFANALAACLNSDSHSEPTPPMPSPHPPPVPRASPRRGQANPEPTPPVQAQTLKDRLIDIQPLMVRVPKIPADLPGPMRKKYKQLLNREFEIGEYPVTNIEYQRFVAVSHRVPTSWKQRAFPGSAFPPERATHPVVGITQQDADAYCAWLSSQTRNRYRLPTPQEWEWAASGPQRQQYPWGKQFDQERCNTEESGIGETTPVDKYLTGKSFCGAKDMSGNVWEMTQSSRRSFNMFDYKLMLYVIIIGTLLGIALGIYAVASYNGRLPDMISYVIFDILIPGILFGLGASFVSYCVAYAIGYCIFLIQLRPTLRGGAWNASSDKAPCFSRNYKIDEKATGFRLLREV